uniref:DYW domain-containing protein n=1 Tax=Ananas comosus var. bracteatus TaxID=296719 RepID=A0A6V7P8V8_ANACO|nr:unnamed protein product [Ananas comosus var. bracteatus]
MVLTSNPLVCLSSSQSFPFPSPSPHSIFPYLKTTETLRDLKPLHALAIKTSQIKDPLVAAEVLRCVALSSDRNLHYARLVFGEMLQPNCFSWNTIIRALSESEGDALEAIILFLKMLHSDNAQPNQYTFPSVLKACARIEAIDIGKQIHNQTIKFGLFSDGFVLTNLVRLYTLCGFMEDAIRLVKTSSLSPTSEANVVLHNILIDGYFRLGMVYHANRIFNQMPKKSMISWNEMIARFAQIGCFREAVEVFRAMQLEGVKPNYVSLVSVLPAISRLGALELGKWVHLYINKNGILVDDVLGSTLVDMYSKCGNIDKAIQVFEGLPKKNSTTWSALISGLAMHGRARVALNHFAMMEKAKVIPSDVVFIGILNACSHAGLVEDGRLFFDRMVNGYKIKPRIEHYTCMVDMLGRAGLLNEAEESILNMPIKPDEAIYKSLLAACRIHGNVDIAKRMADRLLELVPRDEGCYVLLSNIYASLGNWGAMAEVRLKMKEQDIKKDPGRSWITIDGNIHEFIVEDNAHPRKTEIYEMLEEIANKLKIAGYVSDTTQVLLNIDEEEKEKMIYYHSEKIAIAFGLISTREGMTLQVVKNLRVCGDCHSSIKLISKMYNRRIVLRDRNRFHHFENGVCSCNDYW